MSKEIIIKELKNGRIGIEFSPRHENMLSVEITDNQIIIDIDDATHEVKMIGDTNIQNEDKTILILTNNTSHSLNLIKTVRQ